MSFETSATPRALTEVGEICSSPWGVFEGCPRCGEPRSPKQAHLRCLGCGWRDSSFD